MSPKEEARIAALEAQVAALVAQLAAINAVWPQIVEVANGAN